MQTEAQKRAKAKYTKEKVHRLELRFYPTEETLWNKVKNLGSGEIKKMLKFAPSDKEATVNFNFFDLIRREKDNVVADVQKVAAMLSVSAITEEGKKILNKFYLISISYVLLNFEEEKQNPAALKQCEMAKLNEYFKSGKIYDESWKQTLFEYCCNIVKD